MSNLDIKDRVGEAQKEGRFQCTSIQSIIEKKRLDFCSPVYNQNVRYFVEMDGPDDSSSGVMSQRQHSSNRAN